EESNGEDGHNDDGDYSGEDLEMDDLALENFEEEEEKADFATRKSKIDRPIAALVKNDWKSGDSAAEEMFYIHQVHRRTYNTFGSYVRRKFKRTSLE
ncbi:hypothetical protein HK101_003359, partial [Irineochytrium annulatum]